MSDGRKVYRYSEAFKRQVAAEIEDGTFPNVEAARRRYGIRGAETVSKWVRRFGRGDLLAKVVVVSKPGEVDQLKAMAKRIRELEQALAQTQMQSLLAQGHFAALCAQCGIADPEEQKKKLHGKRSSTGGSRGAGSGGSA